MAAKKPTQYRGLLRQPIVRTPETTGDELLLAIRARWVELYRHYGIVPKAKGAIRHLLRALVNRHVPGFRIVVRYGPAVTKPRGKPRALDYVGRVKLQNEMDSLKAKGVRKPEYRLCSDPVLGSVKPGTKPGTLRRIYYRDRGKSKDPLVAIAMEFISEMTHLGEVQQQSKTAFGSVGAAAKKRSAKKPD
jgi:hypothetical protein